MRLVSVPLGVVATLLVAFMVLTASARSFAALQPSGIPAWLQAHVGDGDGQISQVVLERARALYLKKVAQGAVSNPCYFAMDATRPSDLGNGVLGRRYYVMCEADHSFRAISSGHGSGRNLKGVVDFSNGKRCAKNFGNAMDSSLTAGGAYITREAKTSFKGFYRAGAKKDAAFLRTFIQFDGEGEAANARPRVIGGHAAQVLRATCMRKNPNSSYADRDGLVPFGKLVDYAGGRSNGCTSWSQADASQIIAMVKGNPTTLYIYPESRDIAAVAQAAKNHSASAPYWNASCLKEIGAPKFWPRKTLEPMIEQYRKDHPAAPPQPLPMCKES
ncbi:murein L,D-transpeptidase catalytic domain family protein [Mesorhizobium sp. ES1-1]|uniref:murein L,D-transpeptidase catalytic domain family protein n=1 Tax=Mesorhizobium sp. ES1-1 TaxID=2876629 RepID=UPI001CCCC3FF|nr:murein L,D-transpeptidase catalytic domain family protein [Mesorhizobium sp. ES1-1]MBZ9676121.1 murein L,D-transpeptidase catalytic domain family protein [Mesorhizobium sp. ES1-1]